jgi:hypothetical protein
MEAKVHDLYIALGQMPSLKGFKDDIIVMGIAMNNVRSSI